MKTLYIISVTGFIAGLVHFKTGDENAILPKREIVYCVTSDTVPKNALYRDLNSGETIGIWYDMVGRRTLNKRTGAPVDFYVNTSTSDTVLGQGRFIVNDYIMKGADGKWKLDDRKVILEGNELKVRSGDRKFKVDGDDVKTTGTKAKARPEDGGSKAKARDE